MKIRKGTQRSLLNLKRAGRKPKNDAGIRHTTRPVLNRPSSLHLTIKVLRNKAEIKNKSRPYKKNDNCHVEQKNWTHVRETLGYERYDQEDQVRMMNILNILYLNKLQNFFVPQLKLIEKCGLDQRL